VPPIESDEQIVLPSRLTMFTTTWCGYCVRLKSQLERAGIGFDEVDVERDATAAELVEYLNGGYRTVPTLLFPDGEAMTNPSAAEVAAHLAATSA
jgi:mycoredoxin